MYISYDCYMIRIWFSFLSEHYEINQDGIEIENVVYSVNNVNFSQPNSSDEVLISVFLDDSEPVNEVNLYMFLSLRNRILLLINWYICLI